MFGGGGGVGQPLNFNLRDKASALVFSLRLEDTPAPVWGKAGHRGQKGEIAEGGGVGQCGSKWVLIFLVSLISFFNKVFKLSFTLFFISKCTTGI